MSIVSDVEIRLRADIARLQQDMTQARRSVDTALDGMSASAQALKGVLAGMAAGLSVGAFVSFVKNAIDATDALNDMSARTKVAIEDLAGLAYAAKLGDTSLEGVAGAISKLGVNIGKDGEKFRALGITATEPLEAFKQLADIFKNIQDPQQRAAFGAEALGKSWQEAAVLLDGGSAGIATLIDRGKELSGVTDQVAADAGKFNDKLDELGFAAQGVGTRIAAALLPVLDYLATKLMATGVATSTTAESFSPLAVAMKDVIAVAGGIGLVFEIVGRLAGAVAAQIIFLVKALYDLARFDWSGFVSNFRALQTVGSDFSADTSKAVKDFAEWERGLRGVGTTAKDVKAEMADPFNAEAAAKNAAKVASFLNSAEIKGARDKAAADSETAAKKEKAAYAGIIASIKEKMTADLMEINGAAAITPVQQARIKLDQELAAGKVVLTAAHIKEAHALLDAAEALEKNAETAKQVRAAVAALADERAASYTALVAEAAANENLVETYGKTKLQIMQMTLARDEDRLSQRGALELSEDTVAQLEREIEARRRNIAAMGTLEVLEEQTKASDKAAEAQKEFWKSIDETAHATFVSILDGSKDTATRLKDTFKSVFFDWLYQMTIKKWIINIGTATAGGGVSGLASAATGTNGAGGLLSMGKSIYDGFASGFAGVGASLGGYVTTLGNLFGSSATSAFGAGMGLTSSQAAAASAAYNSAGMAGTGSAISAGSTAGAAAGIFAGAAGGYFGGNLISGQYGSKGTVAAGTAIGAAIGSIVPVVGTALGALVGGLLGGVANRLFGMGEKKVQSTMIEGSLTATGATGNNVSTWTQKGGWFRSDKKGTDTSALSSEQSAAFASTYKAILDVSKVLGDTIGADTAALSTRVQALRIDLTGLSTDAEKLGAVTKYFEGVADSVALELVPSLRDFQVEGESLSATMQRLVVNYAQVDEILRMVGKTVGAVGAAGVAAREHLIAAAGGVDALGQGVAFFQQNFLTGAEQLAPIQKQVTDALAKMGLSGLTTVEQFKTAALGLDLATAAGADLFAKMLTLAPSFKTVADAAGAAQKAAEELAAAQVEAAKAAAEAAKAVADAEAEKLSALIAASREALRDTVSAALDAAKAAIDARKGGIKDAFDDLMAGLSTSIEKWTGKITELKSLSSLLTGAKVGATQNAASRESAQAQIETALAIAKASGVLPSADSLKDAISAVTADSSNQFATLIEYQREQQRAARSIAGLSGLTEDQLSTAELTLRALQDQKAASQVAYDRQISALDALVLSAQRAAEIALGEYTATMSVADGVRGLAVAIAALQLSAAAPTPGAAKPGGGVTGGVLTVEDLYRTVLGREGEAAGVAFWRNAFGAAVDSAEYADFIRGAAPELAALAGKTSIPPAPPGAPAQTNAALSTALTGLTAQMGAMQTAMTRTANSTQQLAQQFDAVSAGGNALFTESA